MSLNDGCDGNKNVDAKKTKWQQDSQREKERESVENGMWNVMKTLLSSYYVLHNSGHVVIESNNLCHLPRQVAHALRSALLIRISDYLMGEAAICLKRKKISLYIQIQFSIKNTRRFVFFREILSSSRGSNERWAKRFLNANLLLPKYYFGRAREKRYNENRLTNENTKIAFSSSYFFSWKLLLFAFTLFFRLRIKFTFTLFLFTFLSLSDSLQFFYLFRPCVVFLSFNRSTTPSSWVIYLYNEYSYERIINNSNEWECNRSTMCSVWVRVTEGVNKLNIKEKGNALN